MSKNKDFEKKLEKEQIEKIKPEKELKIEIKEKPEKRELKEYKELKLEKHEKLEKIEIKERIKDFKDLEKRLEKPGKEIVEGGGFDPGIVFRAEKPEEKPEEAAGAVKMKEKEDIELKQKQLEKIKPEKEFPDKVQKEIEKIKPEKEFEKFHKEIEKIKPEKEFPEKFQVKSEFEKPSAETRLDPGAKLFKGTGSPEDRLGELEDALERLTHFIGVDLRPDLTTGALKGEPDVGGTGGEAKSGDQKKPK
jgi:hypothetical protein